MFFRFKIFCVLLLGPLGATAQPYTLESPSGFLKVVVETQPTLQWRLDLRGEPLLLPAPIGVQVDLLAGDLGPQFKHCKVERRHIDSTEHPVVWQKSALIRNHYNELVLRCDPNWGVIFRAYDEGVAYRFFVDHRGDTIASIDHETFTCRPANAEAIWWSAEEGFYSSNERVAQVVRPEQLTPQSLASLPALMGTRNGVKILLTESNLFNYPGLWLRGDGTGGLRGDFPRDPKYTVRTTNRDVRVTDREPHLTRFADPIQLPWRVFLVAEKDEQLLTNQIPWLLAEPSQIINSAWIKPGKAAWDWWSNLNVYGPDVTFKAGINTATYRYFIDFAAQNGLEYVVLDEGWSDTGDLLRVNPDLDLPALAAYANSKNVGLILWCTWLSLDLQLDPALDQFERWGIRGIKVDFMQRDDRRMVNYYWRVARAAAQRHLIVDFHGAHKPTGLQRTWPNVLTFEGVYGLEQCKWDKDKRIDPEHDVTLPFTRNVAGPMDYTPGAMLNRQRADWSPSWQTPASLGTRCHELAKYVVFESPLQMLADSPTNYQKETECLQFLSTVPAVWAQTVALPSQVGDYVAVARQAANGLWYVAAMTDWTARELVLDTRFLPEGEYEVEIFADGPNAARAAQDFTRTFGQHLRAGDPLKAKMAPGGGFVAVLKAVKE